MQLQEEAEADLLVIGSGAAGLSTALRAAALGLRVTVAEKSHFMGGTSALSGGAIWIPGHGLDNNEDTADLGFQYLTALCGAEVDSARLRAFVNNGRALVEFLNSEGISYSPLASYPDYFPDKVGASMNRALFPRELDGRVLASDLASIRQQPLLYKLLERYSLSLDEAMILASRGPAWRSLAGRIILRYWTDVEGRRRSRRDRRLTLGNALIGGLVRACRRHGVVFLLNSKLEKVEFDGSRVSGATFSNNNNSLYLKSTAGVVLACGGFEQNQQLRQKHFPVATKASWSLTPPGGNEGDAMAACSHLDVATEQMDCGWWSPTMQLPSSIPNVDVVHPMFFDHRRPHSICVNRLGKRFVNEGCSYDLFGIAMIEDQKKTGANVPCWMIFDTHYRRKFGAGGIAPSFIRPDKSIGSEIWDRYLFRATTIRELASKIAVDPETLQASVDKINLAAATGMDIEYGRGESAYDRYFGDLSLPINPCLGAIDKAPFYAVRVDLGDLGTKGGFKVDHSARVLNQTGSVVNGLYAVGNCSASPFGNVYPGAGGTLAPAMVFGFLAAEDAVGLCQSKRTA